MFFAATPSPTPAAQTNGFTDFLTNYGLLILVVLLLVFMFWSSRRRSKRTKEEQEAKMRQMVPGTKVLLQGGLYGTLTEYDPDDLSKPARVELAPGVEIEVHSQAILRVVEPDTSSADQPADDAAQNTAWQSSLREDADASAPHDDKPQA